MRNYLGPFPIKHGNGAYTLNGDRLTLTREKDGKSLSTKLIKQSEDQIHLNLNMPYEEAAALLKFDKIFGDRYQTLSELAALLNLKKRVDNAELIKNIGSRDDVLVTITLQRRK